MNRTRLLVALAVISLSGCALSGRPSPEQLANNTFAECPNNYEEIVRQRVRENLIDPDSAKFRFSTPEKFVYGGQYGHMVAVGLNAKNRLGGYVGEHVRQFMCFPDGSVSEINEFANGMAAGLKQAGY